MRLIAGLLVLALGVVSVPAVGQVASGAAVADGKDTYAAESVVHKRLSTVYRFAADGTGSREITVATRIQSDAAARQLGVVSIGFAGGNERVELDYVRARKPDGSVVETPVTDAQEMPQEVTRQAPFYSDLKEKQIPVRNLRVGDTLEYKARIVQTRAEAPGEFWGQESFGYGNSNTVVLEETIELRVPKGKYVRVWSPEHAPVVSEENSEVVYRWKGSQLEPTVTKDGKANTKEIDPEGELPSVAWTTFKSWQDVGAWYRGLEADRIVADADVKAKVAELTAGKTTEEEKVRALYSYVATQVRYIGVAFGVGRYQPHPAGGVLRNQYGDCKDKHTLLAAMLTTAGLHPEAVLIGAGIRFNPDVPSPIAFNHLITTLPVDGKQVWLDSTAEVAPYGMLVITTRDKQALVVPETGVAKVERTPAAPPFAPFSRFAGTGTLSKEGTMKAHIEYTTRGDDELVMRAMLRQVPPGQWDQFTQVFSQGIGFAGTTSHAEAGRPDVTSDPEKLAYDYEREKTGDWDNYKILPLFPPIFITSVDEKNPPKKFPIELGEPRVETSISTITLPDGWGAELPKAVHEKAAFASFDKTYKIDHNVLTVERRVEILQRRVPADDWKAYKKWLDATVSDGESYIQLTSTAANAGEKGPPMAGAGDQTDVNVLRMAYQALQRNDPKTARQELDLAKGTNPNQPGLWRMYATVDLMEKKTDEAVRDMEHELAAHPDQTDLYDKLVKLQLELKHQEDAKQTLRKQIQAMPQAMQPVLSLSQMLMSDGANQEAATLLEAAANRAPGDSSHQVVVFELGRAQMRSGQREKGKETLISTLNESNNPGIVNDAAYELANANVELDVAEKSVRKALETLTTESAGWTLDGDVKQQAAKSAMLIATWDTVGWILFREGKLDEAKGYVMASWLNGQHAEVGLHLGEIEEAQGHKPTALGIYQLAKITQRPESSVLAELQRRIEALSKEGISSSPKDIGPLQRMEILRTENSDHAKGIADYEILISSERVVEVRPTPDAATVIEGGPEKVQKIGFKGWTPPGSTAKVRLRGLLNCQQSASCMLSKLPM